MQEGFLLKEPKEAEIDAEVGAQRIEALLSGEGVLIEKPDLKKLGLHPPFARVKLTSVIDQENPSSEEEIELSRAEKDGRVVARRVADGAVVRLPMPVALGLRADETLIRSLDVTACDHDDVASVEIVGAKQRQRFHAAAPPDNPYIYDEPPGFAVDTALASEVVDALCKLRAVKWVAQEDSGLFGLSEPRVVAKFRVKAFKDRAEKVHELRVGQPTSGGAYATITGDGAVFVVSRRVIESLETLLLERGGFTLATDIITELTIEGNAQKVGLRRDGDVFRQTSGEVDLAPAQIRQIVEGLGAIRPQAALHIGRPTPSEGFSSPVLTIHIKRAPGLGELSEPVVFEFGAGDTWHNASIHYARRAGLDATFVVPRQYVASILQAL
jgi:hypothetical protein